jgi:allantoin racemase
MRRVALINPNSDTAATKRMVLAAQDAGAPLGLEIFGVTVAFGARLITNEAELAEAAEAVEALVPDLPALDGVIVSAFGDPGLERLRTRMSCPAVGIGECALAEAAAGGRRFAVVTTTPGLVESIARAVARLDLTASFAGVVLTNGDAQAGHSTRSVCSVNFPPLSVDWLQQAASKLS